MFLYTTQVSIWMDINFYMQAKRLRLPWISGLILSFTKHCWCVTRTVDVYATGGAGLTKVDVKSVLQLLRAVESDDVMHRICTLYDIVIRGFQCFSKLWLVLMQRYTIYRGIHSLFLTVNDIQEQNGIFRVLFTLQFLHYGLFGINFSSQMRPLFLFWQSV